MYLPASEAQVAAGEEGRTEARHRGGPKALVLLVDDDSDVRLVVSAPLEALGHRVAEAPDGAAGLAAVEREAPDLAMMDFAMPGMNGVEAARLARARRPNLPILFATGYADSAVLSEAADEEIVQKPFGEAELSAKVNRLLRRRRRAEAAEAPGAHAT